MTAFAILYFLGWVNAYTGICFISACLMYLYYYNYDPSVFRIQSDSSSCFTIYPTCLVPMGFESVTVDSSPSSRFTEGETLAHTASKCLGCLEPWSHDSATVNRSICCPGPQRLTRVNGEHGPAFTTVAHPAHELSVDIPGYLGVLGQRMCQLCLTLKTEPAMW